MKRKILVAHPLQQHSYKTANAFAKTGDLCSYDTTIYYNSCKPTYKLLERVLSKDDVNEFANKIIYCIENRDVVKQVGEKAQETVYLHWRDATKFLLDRYYDVVENWKGREETYKKTKKTEKQKINLQTQIDKEEKKKAKLVAKKYKKLEKKTSKRAYN